ncbi:MAG: hypothetical protein AAF211_33655, partial [Myxococcota bacterium]
MVTQLLAWWTGCTVMAPFVVDEDNDGVRAPFDCDDTVPNFGLGLEIPYDGIDNDCDRRTPDDDLDGDGLTRADDCDDQDGAGLAHGTLDKLDVRQNAAPCGGYCDLVVEGGVVYDDQGSRDLSSMHCLVEVGSWLYVVGEPLLESLEGLERLTHVGHSLVLVDLPALESLSGLSQLDAVEGGLWLENADVLTDLASLPPLAMPLLRLQGNEILETVGEPGQLLINRSLSISNNPLLGSLVGLAVTSTLDLGLTIESNPRLVDL